MGHIFIVLVSVGFPLNSKEDAPFHQTAYNYSCADWGNLSDHLRDAAGTELCEWVQLELMYTLLNINARSHLTHFNGLQLLVLLS